MGTAISIRYTAATDPGRRYGHNEDYFLLYCDRNVVVPGGGEGVSIPEKRGNLNDPPAGGISAPLFILCDGLGGCNAGEVASERVAQNLYQSEREDPEGSFLEKIIRVNREIFLAAGKDPALWGMGTTLVALRLAAGRVEIYSVGDSRAYLYRTGNLEQLTEDQSYVWDFYKSGKLTKDQLRFHPNNNIVTHALGTQPVLLPGEINTFAGEWISGDLFLLCSDGLTDLVSEDEILSILRRDSAEERALEETAGDFIKSALREGGRDNITVILVEVLSSVPEVVGEILYRF